MVVSEISPSPLYHDSTKSEEIIEKLKEHNFYAISEIPKFHGDVVFKAESRFA
jgi:hypothetical protein